MSLCNHIPAGVAQACKRAPVFPTLRSLIVWFNLIGVEADPMQEVILANFWGRGPEPDITYALDMNMRGEVIIKWPGVKLTLRANGPIIDPPKPKKRRRKK